MQLAFQQQLCLLLFLFFNFNVKFQHQSYFVILDTQIKGLRNNFVDAFRKEGLFGGKSFSEVIFEPGEDEMCILFNIDNSLGEIVAQLIVADLILVIIFEEDSRSSIFGITAFILFDYAIE